MRVKCLLASKFKVTGDERESISIGPLITSAPGPGGKLALLKIAQVRMDVMIEMDDG
ncbi:MAG: hypothetical protein GY875_11345 [Gammaproteobacteria bacterium]|nr:hypothetical protein [Gammaproteobacteria bacterium]